MSEFPTNPTEDIEDPSEEELLEDESTAPTEGEIEEVVEDEIEDEADDETEAEIYDEPIEFKTRSRGIEERLPMVAIVGRPNVGKSTLFNRFSGRRDALVHDMPGMTRDRRIQRVEWGKRAFLCVDTGGFDIELEDPLLQDVAEQARTAIEEADIILMLTAVNEENHPAEMAMFEIIRRSRKPVLLVVNKCDGPRQELEAAAFYQYGFEEVHTISASHGRGVSALMEAVEELLIANPDMGRDYVSGGMRVAIVGRQNVGKSTLINQLIGEERMIASNLPGTTRDAIDTTLTLPTGDVFTLIDTAGIRRRGKVERGVEKISVLSSMVAIRRADVAIIVVDATSGLTAQDAHIAGYCVDEGCACVVAVNKWDIAEKDSKTADAFTKSLQREWGFLKFAPVIYISALTGQRATKLFELSKQVFENGARRVPTPELNDKLAEWLARKPPPIKQNRRPKVKYGVQTGSHPPSFTLFCNEPLLFHFSYVRYLINCIRENYDFSGTPVRIHFRARKREDRDKRD